jgi:hypothetical protein
VARGDREIIAGALHGVRVAVALGAGQAHGARSEEFLHVHAMAIDTDAVALGLGDLQQIHLHAGEADCLRSNRALGDGWDSLQIQNVDAKEKAGRDQQGDKDLHSRNCQTSERRLQLRRQGACGRKQQAALFRLLMEEFARLKPQPNPLPR